MLTKEELKIAQDTLETRHQIEEIVGSSVGTVKTDLTITDDEFEKAYTEYEKTQAENREQKKQIREKFKKYRPLSIALGLILVVIGIGLTILSFLYDFDDLLIIGAILIFIGIMVVALFSPKLFKEQTASILSKEDFLDVQFVESAKKWLEEAKKNNYYLDLQEQAIIKKYGSKGIKGPKWKLLVGDTDITVVRCKQDYVYSCISFQIESITGIAIQTRVQEVSKSTNTEDMFNKMFNPNGPKKFITETEVSQIKDYLVSLSFNNRVNPYSIYIGTDSNLLLSVVNLLERLTGVRAINV